MDEINPELLAWLEKNGFNREPESKAFSRQLELDGKPIQLQVDFKNSRWGTRYGYTLDETVDPPKFKPDKLLREHALLEEYKNFRNGIADEDLGSKTPPKGIPLKPPSLPGEGDGLIGAEGQVMMMKLETRDDTQIIAEMQGDLQAECLKEYFYSFKQGDRRIVGMSYAGVRAVARIQGNIHLEEPIIEEKPKSFVVKVKGKDLARNFEIWGVAVQAKTQQFRGGGSAPDPFPLQKAVAKAQRNCLKCLIPEKVSTTMYAAWLKNKNAIDEILKKQREAMM